jgi:pSer/pThr/pTyr-binding forkhead associated (FHA) protein
VVLTVNETVKAGKFEITTEVETPQTQSASASDDQKLTQTTTVAAIKPLVDAVLVLVNGDRVVLEGDSIKIGRQATCRVVFNDSNVSREHAQMRRTADGWKILDLGSTNGTKINGQKIVQEQLLVNGDELAFGTSGARFEIS